MLTENSKVRLKLSPLDPKTEDIMSFVSKENAMNKNNEALFGRVVCGGRVEGLVRVINKYADLENVQSGDIMVTAQTDMNYAPYLQQCAGLVTETGGRYCHAGIYARENNLPCITDVKDARKLLLNGEPIILDADRNMVYRVGGKNDCGSSRKTA